MRCRLAERSGKVKLVEKLCIVEGALLEMLTLLLTRVEEVEGELGVSLMLSESRPFSVNALDVLFAALLMLQKGRRSAGQSH